MKTVTMIVVGTAIALCAAVAGAADWPNYRGPHYNGSSTETGIDPLALAAPKRS